MKRLTTLASLAVTCNLFAACDPKPEQPHEGAAPVSPATDRDTLQDGAPSNADRIQGQDGTPDHTAKVGSDRIEREAEADLEPAAGLKAGGEVELKETADGVELEAEIEHASPGKHGFHIHEKGDCSDIAGKSMGGHFNPDGKEHKLPHEGDARHLGDLGNIEVGEDGEGEIKFTLKGATLKEGDSRSLIGKSFVIHEREDSGAGKQPAGDSGAPIACGVIVAEKS